METARLHRAQSDSTGIAHPAPLLRAVRSAQRRVDALPRHFWALTGLIAGLLIAGATLATGNAMNVSGETERTALGFLAVATAVGAFAGVVTARQTVREHERARIDSELASIAKTVETLSAHDVVAVADALADIAQGEGARALRIEAEPVPVPADDPTLRRLAEAVNTTVARLESSVEQFNTGAVEPCHRLFYVGPDDFLLGSICAEELARLIPSDAEILVLLGRFSHAGMELRRRGFESGLRDRVPDAHIAAAFENRYDPDLTYDFVRSYLQSHRRLSGIYSAEGFGVQGAVHAVMEAGRSKEISIVCHDLAEGTMPLIRSGVIAGTVTQDAFGQGYETSIHLYNHIAFGWVPPEQRLSTRMEFVNEKNLDRFWTPDDGLADSAASLESRPKPFGKARKPIRIAVLGIADNPFWRFVRAGVEAASERLAPFGATIDWIPADESVQEPGVHLRAVQRVVAAGYDGIATPIFELSLVPELNRAVDRGMAVATYNSETASLGGLIAALSRQWRRLEETASRLELSAAEDPLTLVGNRRAMETDLASIKAHVETSGLPGALVMIDIDRFKPYNDTNGHIAGDHVLREVAGAIRRATRPSDRVYRYGGEEFLVALQSVTDEGAESAAQRIVSAVRALALTHPSNDPWGVVTVSAGVGMMRRGEDLERSLEEADVSLYGAKAAGRNRAFTPRGGKGPS